MKRPSRFVWAAALTATLATVISTESASAHSRFVRIVSPYRVWSPAVWWGGHYRFHYGYNVTDAIRAAGEAAYLRSEGLINLQKAENLRLDNHRKTLQVRLQRRRMANAATAVRRATDRKAREKYLAMNRDRARNRKPVALVDVETGRVNWPQALKNSQFFTYRRDLEKLIALKAEEPENRRLADSIREIAGQLELELRRSIHSYRVAEYLKARNFVQTLRRTA